MFATLQSSKVLLSQKVSRQGAKLAKKEKSGAPTRKILMLTAEARKYTLECDRREDEIEHQPEGETASEV